MIKAVIFDCDGVILKYKLFSDRYAKKFNIPIQILMPFFEQEFHDLVTGKNDLKKVLKHYLKSWQWSKSVDDLVKYWLSEDEIDEMLLQLINRLKRRGVKVYLGSNQEKYRAEYIKTKLGFKDLLHETYFSHSLGVKKPDAKFYKKIFNNLKKEIKTLEKSEVFFIDDELDNISSARKIGFNVHHYKGFNKLKEEIAQHLNE